MGLFDKKKKQKFIRIGEDDFNEMQKKLSLYDAKEKAELSAKTAKDELEKYKAEAEKKLADAIKKQKEEKKE